MKKTNRVVAFVLVLAFVFAFMAMSASAAITEVQPRGTCPQCINGYVTSTVGMVGKYTDYRYTMVGYNECDHMTMSHAHYKVLYEVRAICNNCSFNEVTYSYWDNDFCPYQ